MDKRSDTVLVIGLGSPIMTDDAIGLEVVQEIEDMHLEGVETRQEAVGGLDIRSLAEEVVSKKLDVMVLPQLHKIIWGNKQGV